MELSWTEIGIRTARSFTIHYRMRRCATSLLQRSLVPSKRFVVCFRHISNVNRPQYPSPRDQELVNDEFYDVVANGAKSELEDALKVKSPVGYWFYDLQLVQICSNELAPKTNKRESRNCRSAPRLLCID